LPGSNIKVTNRNPVATKDTHAITLHNHFVTIHLNERGKTNLNMVVIA